MESKNKIPEVSLLRGIGALSVILIHITSTYSTYPSASFIYLIYGILNKFCNYAVPLFLFISIALLMLYAKSKNNFNISSFYKKRFIKILIPYFVFIAIYYFYLNLNGCPLINPITDPRAFIKTYILCGSICYHLYFIPIIIQMYILAPLIWIALKKVKIKLSFNTRFIIVFLILLILQYLFSIINKYYIWPNYKNSAVIVFSYILPIGLGAWIGYNYNEFMKSKLPKIITSVIAAISGCYFIWISLFPVHHMNAIIFPIYTATISIVLLLISKFINKKNERISSLFEKISIHSFTIYLIHPLILFLLEVNLKWTSLNLTSSTFFNYSLYTCTKFLIVLALSYVSAVGIAFVKQKLLQIIFPIIK